MGKPQAKASSASPRIARPGRNLLTARPQRARTGYFNCLRMKRSMVMCFCESWTIVPSNIVKRPP